MIDYVIGVVAVAAIVLGYRQVAKWDREHDERHRPR